jgi:hypothetical protein
MYGDPGAMHAAHGRQQHPFLRSGDAGIGYSALRLVVGAVSPDDYRHAILPHTSRIFARSVRGRAIHFGGGRELLGLLRPGADVRGRLAYPRRAVRQVEQMQNAAGASAPSVLAPWGGHRN